MDHPVYIFDFAQSRQSTYYNLANCGSRDGEGIFERSWGGGGPESNGKFSLFTEKLQKIGQGPLPLQVKKNPLQ